MMALIGLLLLAVLATSSAATPITGGSSNIPLTKRFDFSWNGSTTLAEIDRARAAALRTRTTSVGKRAVIDETVKNIAVSYTAQVKVGSTSYQLLIDTGSSNTWVGAIGGNPYQASSMSQSTGNRVGVHYGSGSFSGDEYLDQVTLGNRELVIDQQSIGVATSSQGFHGVDGILGIGPVDLTRGTVTNVDTVPTVTDNLFSTGVITHNVVSVFFRPVDEFQSTTGVLTWGGVNPFEIQGEVTYVPITNTSPASKYWGIDQTVSYGSNLELITSSGIVDTGTTLVLLATNAFEAYQSTTGGVMDSTTGLLKITRAQYDALKPLHFKVGNRTFTLSPNGQIWPRALNTKIGGQPNAYYLIVADLGSLSGHGLDFILGYTFLERFYSVYDTGNQRVGLAETFFTNWDTN